MAVVMPFVAWHIFRIIRGSSRSTARIIAAAFFAGYISLTVAAVLTGFLFGIQPVIAVAADGKPLYAPYPISIAVPAMLIEHLVLFGFIEGIVTSLVVKFLASREMNLIHALKEK